MTIDRFMKNIRLGRAHYVSYAITTGYRSINWQTQDQLGYTALHLAIVKGYVDVVTELLKYNADPNIRSGIGNYPLHDCWVFWKAPVKRDIRLEQCRKTCELIRLLCGYGANPDTTQVSNNSTPLHLACRYGPIHAVILLLGFQANPLLRNQKNQTPLDIAIEYQQVEIQRILEYWNCIRNQLVHVDFIIQWKIFLHDPQAQITNSMTEQSVEKILFELRMRDNLRKQRNMTHGDGKSNYLFSVDDEFLTQCKLERNFIEKLKNQNKFYQDDAAAAAAAAGDGNSSGNSEGKVSYEPGSWQAMTGYGKKKLKFNSTKKKKLPPVREYYLKILAANSPALPQDRDPEVKKKSLIARLPSRGVIEEEESGEEDEEEEEEQGEEVAMDATRGGEVARGSQRTIDLDPVVISSSNETSRPSSEEVKSSFIQERTESTAAFLPTPADEPVPEATPDVPLEPKPKTSHLLHRRKLMANRINMDGKFESFTSRPCTSSALNLSRRTENAPLEKTLEEYSLARYLTTPSKTRKLLAVKQYDVSKKERERLELLKSTKGKKNVSNFGSYVEGGVEEYRSKPSQRQQLYDRLSAPATAAVGLPMSSSLLGGMPGGAGVSTGVGIGTGTVQRNESYKGKKIDMNSEENRSLFVSKDLIPPKKEMKSIEELKQKLALELGAGGRGGEDDGSDEISSQASSSSLSLYGPLDGEGKGKGGDVVDTLEILQKEKEIRERQKLLSTRYAEGRLTSTHRVKKIVQDPWSTVKGNYQVSSKI
jgi:hypothetical protein